MTSQAAIVISAAGLCIAAAAVQPSQHELRTMVWMQDKENSGSVQLYLKLSVRAKFAYNHESGLGR